MRCAFQKTLILLPIPHICESHTYSTFYNLHIFTFHIVLSCHKKKLFINIMQLRNSFLCFLFNCDIILGIPIEFIGDFFNNGCFGCFVIFDIKIFFANFPHSFDLNDLCLIDTGL